MSVWDQRVDLVKDIGNELGLESADAARRQDGTCIDLKWTKDGVGMFLPIPGEHFARLEQDRLALKTFIVQRLASGEAEQAPN